MKRKKRFSWLALLLALVLSFTSCAFPGLGGNARSQIVIAAGNTTERQILAYLIQGMIQKHTQIKSSIINNLGSTFLIHTAMVNGNVNVCSGMYSGTSLTGELGMPPETDSEKALKIVQEEYHRRYQRKWYDSYGFANTYAFMVSRKFAEENHIKKVSDLQRLKDAVKVGIDSAWLNRPGDGYSGFKEKYGYGFSKLYPMEIALVYSAIQNGNMDVVLGYSTDGRINSYDLVLLEDDQKLFPAYDCAPVATEAIVKKYPELDQILTVLSGKITSEQMQAMNRRSDEDLVEPKNVAREFLEKNHYFTEEMKK